MTVTKGFKKSLILLSISFLAACNTSKATTAQRLQSISKIDNFTFSYHTVIEYPELSIIFDGEGQITKEGLSSSESSYSVYEYELSYIKESADLVKYESVEKYIEDYLLKNGGTYTIDEENNLVTISDPILYYTQNFLTFDLENKQLLSTYKVFVNGEAKLINEEILEPEVLTYKDFISENMSLFEEVIQDKNRDDNNSYEIEFPNSYFYYASSGLLLSEHKMSTMRITFEGTAVRNLYYVFHGREISTSISNIGSTVLIKKPIL